MGLRLAFLAVAFAISVLATGDNPSDRLKYRNTLEQLARKPASAFDLGLLRMQYELVPSLAKVLEQHGLGTYFSAKTLTDPPKGANMVWVEKEYVVFPAVHIDALTVKVVGGHVALGTYTEKSARERMARTVSVIREALGYPEGKPPTTWFSQFFLRTEDDLDPRHSVSQDVELATAVGEMIRIYVSLGGREFYDDHFSCRTPLAGGDLTCESVSGEAHPKDKH